ncbi:hypothetical protein PVAND_006222 [Polypedilum vanderplanki]|uniref:ACB domain-containing protein n=1 Tax=Polypedilum vanderplanki TaxID=319348 RepID=A0A9J6C3B7_POLVA|nr:hypothetical protein PVAND_006222 [Polypedilum vanderplanki]
MSIEDRFNAAVNVIRGLPAKGPYQPSYDMMLRFYSYFKQSTEGPCKGKRPAFWDIVGKAKYDSWKRLGDMSKEKAMEAYVDELRKIVETMSYTQTVAEFYDSLNEMDNVNVSDLELVAPELMRSKSESNSPVHQHREPINGNIQNAFAGSSGNSETSDDDEEYIDTVEDEMPIENIARPRDYSHQNGGVHKKNMPMTEVTNKLNIDQSLRHQLVQSITDNMKADLQQVNTRISSLEQKIAANEQRRQYPKWWPFKEVSPSFLTFTIIWPVAVAILFRLMQKNKLNHGVGKRS